MPRSREFDPDKTLLKAMELFWRKGYAETSMRDLVEYTGVAHAGLYSAFGSKRELYKSAMLLYKSTTMDYLLGKLEAPDSGREEIEQFFEAVLHIIRQGDFNNGCFMVNTAVEFGDESGDILADVNEHMERMIKAFEGALLRAKKRGDVPSELETYGTAEFLVSVFNGLAVQARARGPYNRAERTVRIALKELD